MNGHANCILAVCCPPRSEGQVAALSHEMAVAVSGQLTQALEHQTYDQIAEWILKNYDLAPPGSLQPFKDAVRDLAREGYVPAEI